ncbi:MAG TPA: phosphatidylserine decarboxylase family protein [Ignavibacteria bacterium]|nr:phosphatidylserine decarboxylase family protein [Bacteroidota bacterium]HRE10232.1 phosphatidylserine decarboxylase family protein [Ignavibacteria bacterium]HRF65375.1 phosphatidylserine decarboxylase family protein [Ignavibacteria bacterium]HRJ04252.1 phosphatidylserine decarboxylase family protein [Ignavibacteria bacterium]HRJ86020.1 phosphatidylserine decarboxylase family protein [Ignavibacteria bacterium]
MRLTIYGRSTVLTALLITLAVDIAALLIPNEIAKLVLLVLSVVFISFTLYFFRDPVRHVPKDLKSGDIISPADGKVMMIEEIEENEFIKGPAKVIGIFLSPLNVHVNRVPISGTVKFYQYIKGEFIAAYDHASADKNERTVIGIEGERFKVLFKQITGFVARRIVCELRVGDKVKIGEKFGMIKFGSRTDVIMPINANIKVSVNQKVTGGITLLAEVPE